MSVINVGHIIFDGCVLVAVNLVLWLLSLVLGKTWPVDFIWSNWPIAQAAMIYRRGSEGGNCDRQLITFTLTCVWGFRLTHNFVARGGVGHEDWRYTDMRTQFGKHFWWASLFTVFLGQTIFMFGPCLALYGALLGPESLDVVDTAGALVCVGAILLESAADIQMNNFVAARREKRTESVMIDSGLWMWSRHPNYLGEVLWWWGLWLIGARAAPVWTVVGPILITLLFLGVSVKLMEDRQLKNKGEAFVAYRREVGSSLLLLPPFLNRRLGALMYGSVADGTPTPVPSK